MIVLEQLNPFQASEVIGKLARALEKVPGTQFVDSKIPAEFLKNRQLLLIPKADLLHLESLVEEAVDYARGQFGGFFGEDELFNPTKLQALADRFHIFEDINPYHKGKQKKNYYIFVKPKGTVTDTDFTEQYVRLVQEAIDQTGLEIPVRLLCGWKKTSLSKVISRSQRCSRPCWQVVLSLSTPDPGFPYRSLFSP